MRRPVHVSMFVGAAAAVTLLGGCFLAAPLRGADGDAGGSVDAQTPDSGARDAGPDDAGSGDAGHERDAGPRRDAGPTDCPPGTVDLDGEPGCECTISAEICNGIDDDCDPDTGDGVGDPLFNQPCDSPGDEDLCTGVWVCNAAQLACTDDPTEDFVEVCGGGDEDCDGDVDEATASDARTWFSDSDGDGYGNPTIFTRTCETPDEHVEIGGDCNDSGPDVYPGALETCNGIDDDCDSTIDEGGCGCHAETFDGRGYLFCDTELDWEDARQGCRDQNSAYRLVRIDGDAENTFVTSNAASRFGRSAWMGLYEEGAEGTWRWTIGAAGLPWESWAPDEPSNSPPGEDCAEINHPSVGLWNDARCSSVRPFVCEWSG